MITPDKVPQVESEERTARYLVSKSHINRQTLTVKANAFIPKPYLELSVTRLIEITDAEIWTIGKDIATSRGRTLRGRADVIAATYLDQKLQVVAAPIDGNPNHANVTGWPDPNEESSQLMIAKEIAAVAKLVQPPQ